MRTLKSVPVGIAIAHLSLGVLIGSTEPQRSRQSNRAYEIPRALAGVLLPESLQTILLMHLARDITKAQATESFCRMPLLSVATNASRLSLRS